MIYKHVPVMMDKVLEYLAPRSGQLFLDCTLGGGGYTFAIGEKVGEKGMVISLDADEMAIKNAQAKIKKSKINNVFLYHGNFENLQAIINEISQQEKKIKNGLFDGIVFDLGLSSAQLADQARGFSFQLDAPLNMSFGDDSQKTIKIVNKYKQEELEKIFKEYGEEKFSRQIAKKICESRRGKEIVTTGELSEIIKSAIPAKFQKAKINPSTKVFQALRIETNQELENLQKALSQAVALLKPKGRLALVSFHSLEDRIVKRFFKEMSKDCICPKEVPLCVCQNKAKLKIITKKPLFPGAEEIKNNPRARSAKMRVAEKI